MTVISQMDNHAKTLNAVEIVCETCGRKFIFRRYQQEERVLHNRKLPKYCFRCYQEYRDGKQQKKAELENRKRELKRAEEKVEFEEKLDDWNIIEADKIIPQSGNVLYIIGNGFDLMHGVRSSYYSFSQFLGKNSSLKHALENCLTPDDIWASFEDALAHFNVSMMADSSIVDMWLDTYNAYQDEASAADYYAAIEAAANPMMTIAYELPERFRKWVEGLSVGTKDRPLKHMFVKGKVLCFNYTEFVETLYGMQEENVCYIHGCRRRKKGHPKEELILGHRPGDSDEAFARFKDSDRKREKNTYRHAMRDIAQENVVRIIGECDEGLTKHSDEIIKEHCDFFQSLCNIEEVISVGHSYSPVDRDYFKEIVSGVSNISAVRWYFGCYGLQDLNNLETLLANLGIEKSSVWVFRTDTIKAAFENDVDTTLKVEEKVISASVDEKWFVTTKSNRLFIYHKEDNSVNYDAEFSSHIYKVFFTDDSKYLMVFFRGAWSGICIFRLDARKWEFVGELENIRNQSLINPRLRHIFLNGAKITFIYNNRIREYSLESGQLLCNRQKKYDAGTPYPGIDILERLEGV